MVSYGIRPDLSHSNILEFRILALIMKQKKEAFLVK